MYLLILFVSIAIGIARFAVPGHDLSLAGSYEAVAHIWAGILLALCFQDDGERDVWKKRLVAISALAVLTLIELIAFLLR